ncbi:uncharacterized protein LOC114542038 [Dendronephthya gigantea]|uniref:uncharacterized protein LOC114542038 n=1 Tax=Dendronephthya gigantea TaxID=151771 RepID=UPI00106A0A9D|nr:uncharacterized protein LOC114542038 [Dendronephthya gigantea]
MSNREMFFLVISTILIYELQWMGARELPTSSSKTFSSSGVNKLMLVNSNEESEDSPNSEAEEDEDWERDSIEESKDSPSEEEAEKEDDTTEGNPKGVSGESSDSEEEEDEPSEDDIALGSDDYPDSEFEENEPTEEDFEDESEVEEEEEPTEEDFDEESEDSETEEDEPAGKRGFRRHRYKIFLTEDVRPIGITANLLSHRRGGCQKLLRIVRIYGNNALARVFLKCGRLSKFLGKLWLRLVIIRRNSGDRFLNSGCNINDRSSDLGGKHGGRDSDALLRLNNHEAGEAREEMMAAVKVEKYLKCAMNRILKVYNRGGEKFFLAWRINTLFSQGALRNLARRHSCEQRKVEHCPRSTFTFRTIDGTCNNIRNPLFGSAPGPLNRLVPAKYFDFDGLDEPIGFPGQVNVPNIPATLKVVQRFIIQQNQPSRRPLPHSHLLMQFGQFLDHDVGLSPESQCSDNCQGITIDGSADDFAAPCYSIQPFGNAEGIHFARSASECQIKNGRFTKREQINVDTSFVDASQVYGSGKTLARDLRDLRSKGLLKTTLA